MPNPFSGIVSNFREGARNALDPTRPARMRAEVASNAYLDKLVPQIESNPALMARPEMKALAELYRTDPTQATRALDNPALLKLVPEPAKPTERLIAASGDDALGRSLGLQPGQRGEIIETVGPDGQVVGRSLKRSDLTGPPQTTVTVNTGDDAFAKELAGLTAQQVSSIREQADTARRSLTSLGQARAALESGKFESGAFGDTRLQLSQMAELVGIDPTSIPGLGEAATAEQVQAASEVLAARVAEDLGTRTTNMSLQMARNTVPGLLRTPDGNRAIMDIMQRQAELDIERQKVTEDFIAQNNGFRAADGTTLNQVLFQFDRENPTLTDELFERIGALQSRGTSVSELGADRLPRFAGEVNRMEVDALRSLVSSASDEDLNALPQAVIDRIAERLSEAER